MPSFFFFILTLTCKFCLYSSQAFDPKISLPTSDEELELHSSGLSVTNNTHNLKTFIVHVKLPYGKKSNALSFQELESLYLSFLPPTIAYSHRRARMVQCYRHVITGFAAKLSPEEVNSMAKKDGFVSATPEKFLSLQTTGTPAFLGLQQNTGFWRDSNYGSGLIIGVLDTGVTPNHPSFNDLGVPPRPTTWGGRCDLGTGCNNKLIGARSFVGDTSVDGNGHGTHVASIAVGNFVTGANVFGQAIGTASGVAPLAHLAVYKVCTNTGSCPENSMLAGIDRAVDDGVNIISISAGYSASLFHLDNVAVGTFAAIQRGIFVSCAIGNSGPAARTLSNQAPWLLSVGASTTNRNIRATAVLGNGVQINGESLRQFNNFPSTSLPLVYPGRTGNQEAAQCQRAALNNVNVRGMVVVCNAGGIGLVEKGQNVLNAGGAAMILVNKQDDGDTIPADEAHVLPATHVGYRDGDTIKAYLTFNPSPQATIIFRGTVYEDINAPEVASFSSRGPNTISPGILKPDIIGPGNNILAAWPSSVDGTTTRATFNIMWGTSFACPHLSGTAALLKNTHLTWSPAAIKSAIMTTATVLNANRMPITDQNKREASWYDIGAGHVDPSRANDPGLVYDIQPDDYIPYLCGLGYTDQQVSIIVHRQARCSTVTPISEAQLNYPTFSITLGFAPQTYTRTVTNVGDATSSYTVSGNLLPSSVRVDVTPNILAFTRVNQQLTYSVTFTRSAGTGPQLVSGYLTWTSNRTPNPHVVRSQISIVLS